ncbi:MAG: type II secretion system F family protein [Acidimicrobiales bacterium]
MNIVAILAGLGVGAGISALTWTYSKGPRTDDEAPNAWFVRARDWLDMRSRWRVVAPACVAAILIGAWTGWPVAAVLAGFGVVGLKALFGTTATSVASKKLEAIASWAEMLRDTLVAASGLAQAVIATAETAPLGVRAEARHLAARLEARAPMRDALVAFADEIADPTADVIVASLLMASEERAQRLSDLLTELAESARLEVSMRLHVEASRSSARTAVRTVAVVSVGFIALLLLVARGYLAPYASVNGEMVLALVGGAYALGLFLMARMARPRAIARLLEASTSGASNFAMPPRRST